MYTKTIEMHFERDGKRTRLTGFIGELRDGEMLLHSQVYSTNSQAEQALDRIVYELLTDLADQGLVDDVPAAMEAEHVSSTHLPSWQAMNIAGDDIPPTVAPPFDEPLAYTTEDIAYYSKADECRMNVLGTYWQICGAPADGPCYCDVMVVAKPTPDLIAEAQHLVDAIQDQMDGLYSDWSAEGRFPPSVSAYHLRLCKALNRAEKRQQRRDFTPPDVEFAPLGWAA